MCGNSAAGTDGLFEPARQNAIIDVRGRPGVGLIANALIGAVGVPRGEHRGDVAVVACRTSGVAPSPRRR